MTARKKTARPEPVVVSTICSLCGLPWEDHDLDEGEDTPTSLECIRLLKEEVGKKGTTIIYQQPYQPIYPYRQNGYYDAFGVWHPYNPLPYSGPWYSTVGGIQSINSSESISGGEAASMSSCSNELALNAALSASYNAGETMTNSVEFRDPVIV